MERFNLTFCDRRNYGAMLQCYAIQRLCAAEGLSIRYLSLRQPFYFRTFIKHLIPKYHRMDAHSVSFIRKNINVIKAKGDLPSFLSKRDSEVLLLVGSDQVWNPLITNNPFLCQFHLPNVRKRSYACSFGYFSDDERLAKIVPSILDFDNISVREEDAFAYFAKNQDVRRVTCDLDPTLLVQPSTWRDLASKSSLSLPKDYILVFGIYWDPEFNQSLQELHEQTGLPILSVSESHDIFANAFYYGCSPYDFLKLMMQAKYVVTSSFHGVCFSVIFERQFCTLVNPKLPSRITSLLNRLGLEDRISDVPTMKEGANYETANDRLDSLREKSMQAFRGAIRE